MADLEESESPPMKYVLVSGGVISGVGKGVIYKQHRNLVEVLWSSCHCYQDRPILEH